MRRARLSTLLALLLLGACRLLTPAGAGQRDAGPASCRVDRDCPEDMYCEAGSCRYGLRRDSGPADGAGDACLRLTCEALDRSCGSWDNGCGGQVYCGGCGPDQTCSAAGRCECSYAACGGLCCAYGEVCHEQACCAPQCEGRCCGDDGCGGTCPDSCAATAQTCNTASCDCEGDCVPQDCAALGRECGTWPDGCEGDAVCPDCGSDAYCSSAGVCVCSFIECVGACCAEGARCFSGACCSPASCDDLGRGCGNWDDGCGDTVYCGGCATGETCDGNGACVATGADASAADVVGVDTARRDAGQAADAARPDGAAADASVLLATMFCPAQSGGGGGYPCEEDADCEAIAFRDWLYCGSYGYCVQCTINNHCSAGPETTNYCLSERCVGCTNDDDCQVTDIWSRCDDGRCRTCLEDIDCVAGPGNTGKCHYFSCTRCDNDNDCVTAGLGAGCDADTGWCFQCHDDRDCSAGDWETGYCFAHSCEGCLSANDCAAAGFTLGCVCRVDDPGTPAVDEDSCPPGQRCVDGACLLECADAADCPADTACVTGVCVRTCDGGSCAAECEGGSCGTPP